MALKGKQIAGKAPAVKRKKENADKSGGRKRKKPGVIQFFDVAADVREEEEESDEDEVDQDFLDEASAELKNKNGSVKAYELPILPKEEELSDSELERYLEERYKTGSHHVVYAGDKCGPAGDKDPLMRSTDDPTIWRIKCMVGRERQIVFSLMQKYVDLHSLGTKLKMVSAFALEHMKGYFYVEAERQSDVLEACKGLCNIYFSKISPIPNNEVSHLFSVRNTTCEVSISKVSWARLKNGKYKGDLAEVVAVDARKRAAVKLIPRIDLRALAKKLAGGGTIKETTVPAPRMISSSELEDFRPHIKLKHDDLTGKVFETIDGLMFNDGYLYKKVSAESLRYLSAVPSADELQKFKTSKRDESDDMEWLSKLYGEKGKKCLSECNRGTGKGEGTSGTRKCLSKSSKAMSKGLEDTPGTKKGCDFQLHDLVFFGQDDFGVIIGMENDNFQILKDDLDGAKVVNVDLHEIKSGSLDKKFTTLDKHMLKLSLNDTVRVLEGPFEGKQGVIRHICKETIFLYDQNQLENGGHFCANSQVCENISHSEDTLCENDGDRSGIPTFEDSTMSSPKSPELTNKKRWTRESISDFNSNRRADKDSIFSIGQTLRIRVGPLKGHLCRVIALYRSDVTVKLDSQMKVITVKSEHLSEAGVKSIRGNESNFMKPYDGFGAQGPSGDPMEVAGTTANNSGWNSAALTTRRSPWPNFSSSEFLLDSTSENPFGSLISSNNPEKDKGDDPWGSKATSKQVTDNWGKATEIGGDNTVDNKQDQVDGWDKSATTWDRATVNRGFGGSASNQWGGAKCPSGDEAGCSKDAGGSWDTGKLQIGNSTNFSNDAITWDKTDNTVSNWSEPVSSKNQPVTWDKGKATDGDKAGGSWDTGKLQIGNSANFSNDAITWDKTDNAVSNWIEPASSKNQPVTWDKGKATVVDKAGAWDNVTGAQDRENANKSIQDNSWSKAAESGMAKDVLTQGKQDVWNGASAARGNKKWGDSVGSWTQPENKAECLNGSHSGSWGKGEDATDSGSKGWGKDSDNWSKPKVFDSSGPWNKETGESIQEDSWGKTVESSKAKAVQSGNKQVQWNRAAAVRGNETWGNSSGNWTKPEAAQRDHASGWNSTEVKNESHSGNWGRAEGTAGGWDQGWKKDGDAWSKPKASGVDETSWSKGTAASAGDGWNKPKVDDGDQEFGWNNRGGRPRTFDRDRGSGGRRGRGGSRGGNRDHFNRGRSSGRGQSSGWNGENYVNNWTGGESSKNSSSGQNDGQSDGWNKAKSFGGDQQPSWDSTTQNDGGNENQEGWKAKFGAGEKDRRNGNWNNANSFNAGESSGWKIQAENEASGNQSSGWDSKAKSPKGDQSSGWDGKANNWNNSKGDQSSCWDGKASSWNNSKGDQSSSWDDKASNWSNPNVNQSCGGSATKEEADGNKHQEHGWEAKKAPAGVRETDWNSGKNKGGGNLSSGWDNKASNWSNPKSSQSSGWDSGSVANEETNRSCDSGNGWNRTDTSHKDQAAGWKSGTKDSDDSKSNWGTPKGSCVTQSSGWSQKPAANEEAGGIKDQEDGWNRGKASDGGWATGSKSGAAGWGSGSAFGGNQSSGWGKQGNESGSEGQSDRWNRKEFGNNSNGGNWRGGKSFGGDRSSGWNRESSDNDTGDQAGASYGTRDFGRGQSSGSNRGGFGNRGRGRGRRGDRSGGWNSEQNYSGKTDGAGASGSDHGERWTQGGSNKGQWQKDSDNVGSWNNGGFSKGGQWQKESSDNVGSWNSGGFSKGGQWQKESIDNVGSWNREGFSTGGQWQKESGPSKGESGRDGNQARGWNSQGSGWSRVSGAKESGGWNSGAGSRNEGGDGINRLSGQGSGWSRGKDSIDKPGPKDQGSNWKQAQTSEGSQWSSWKNESDSAAGAAARTGGGWNKEASSSAKGTNDQTGNWDNLASAGKGGTQNSEKNSNAGKVDGWNRPNAPDVAQSSSGWNKPTGTKEEANENERQAADPWDKAKTGSWGKKAW